jgi:hypothetical protein
MVSKASLSCQTAYLSSDLEKMAPVRGFDLVYIIAVLAHISDDQEVSELLHRIKARASRNSVVCLFEQVGTERRQGNHYVRRTITDYRTLAIKSGYDIERIALIRFPAHQFFERVLAKLWYKYLSTGATDQEKRIAANGNPVFRALSKIFLLVSGSGLYENPEAGWGNAFFALRVR